MSAKLKPVVLCDRAAETPASGCARPLSISGIRPAAHSFGTRALTGNSQFLLTSVQNIKRKEELDFAVLDAGIGLASCVSTQCHEVFALKVKSSTVRCHRLVGPICHTGNTLYNASYLPELERGDALAIMDSGACFIADATSFSFPQPAIVAISATGEDILVRKAESFEHMVSLDHFSSCPGS